MAVWDCVWFNDEIDLLRWRITLLQDVVDHVLVVEGDMTFTGRPKRSVFGAHESALRELGVDVHHVVAKLDPDAASAWDRELEQHRALLGGLRERASPGDVILAGDVDEVPRPGVVANLSAMVDRPVRLHMQHCNYFANWVQPEPWRDGTWMFLLGQESEHPRLRVLFGEPHSEWQGYVEEYVPDAGWHLSFLGGAEAIRNKWSAYAHQENNTAIDRRPGHLERCFKFGVHFTGRALLQKQRLVDPGLGTLAEVRPDFFRYERQPWRPMALAVMSWTWLRRKPLPEGIRRLVDGSDGLLLLCAPLLLALQGLAALRRQWRRSPPWPVSRPWGQFPRDPFRQ
jgi:beta-1,4-mannosyl-glycoprotein beta-1,4-N-acetylglucosaminyltransferase